MSIRSNIFYPKVLRILAYNPNIYLEQVLDLLQALSDDKRFDIIKNLYLDSEDKV